MLFVTRLLFTQFKMYLGSERCPDQIRSDRNTEDNVPYSLREVSGFFNVPYYLVSNKGFETGPPVYSPYPRRLERLTICVECWSGRIRTLDLPHGSPMLNQLRVRFYGKIRKRILESKNGFCVSWRNPKMDHESKLSTLEEDRLRIKSKTGFLRFTSSAFLGERI